MSVPKESTVKKGTFLKWSFNSDFTIVEETNDSTIKKIKCDVCEKHLIEIRREAAKRNIKGFVLKGVLNYADGVSYVHKGNILRHIKAGGLHDWAKRTFYGNPELSPVPSTSHSSTSSFFSDFPNPKIDEVLSENTSRHYRHLFMTCLTVVMKEMAFTNFKDLIELQQKNGVNFLSGKNNQKSCREFVKYLAVAVKSDIEKMLGISNFFSALMDGSQARKTGAEKELVYVKIVVKGQPVELLLSCQHMPDFGGEDAVSVKTAFDDAFLTKYKLDVDRWSKLLVSICTDGASVNLGVLNGACVKIKQEYDRQWILLIHCSSHRLELAMKDAFTTNKQFVEVDDILVQIYYMFRNSGKAKRILTAIALTLGVVCVTFVKASGTRFQNHKLRAIRALIVNFLPFLVYMENMIENRGACTGETAAKLKGYIKKFQTYSFLASVHLYSLVLNETAHLAGVLQNKTVLITDILDAISAAKYKIRQVVENPVTLPFPETIIDDTVKINVLATNLPATVSFRERNKLTNKQLKKIDKYTHVSNQEYTLTHVATGKQTVEKIKSSLIPNIISAIDKRFDMKSINKDIYDALLISDHTTWDLEDSDFGLVQIRTLAEHFSKPLSFHGFNLDLCLREYKHLKFIVKQKYRLFQNKIGFWKSIFAYHQELHPHFLLLIELCLTLAWSSATVERGFSTTRRILTDFRISLNKDSINDLLVIRVNVQVLSELDCNYEEKLISKAINMYLNDSKKGRYKSKKVSEKSTAKMDTHMNDSFLPTPFTGLFPTSDYQNIDDIEISDSDTCSTDVNSDISMSMSAESDTETIFEYDAPVINDAPVIDDMAL
ncbi:hypothetical protein SNE40_013101 [Patella caerulea]|uniref:HAT C-terminal dimerisation domain-containing protein n=1 Tax=Patella caerulea TaxID=87958 RepID=A0AAN8JMG1_PATCE